MKEITFYLQESDRPSARRYYPKDKQADDLCNMLQRHCLTELDMDRLYEWCDNMDISISTIEMESWRRPGVYEQMYID